MVVGVDEFADSGFGFVLGLFEVVDDTGDFLGDFGFLGEGVGDGGLFDD